MLESVLDTGRRAICHGRQAIRAVSMANQGETVLAWDRDDWPTAVARDRVAGPPRRGAYAPSSRPHRDLLAARTGLVLDPYFSAPKMAWLRRHVTGEES